MRAAVRNAARAVACRSTAAITSQSTGAMPTSKSEGALMLPAVTATSANNAGSRHPPRLSARAVKPTSHGSAAHGSKITEMRAVNASWYGVSM